MGVATLGGVGYLPVAPGTWGTLASVPIAWATAAGPPWVSVVLVVAVTLLAVPAAGTAERVLGEKDAGPVVIDETAGFLVTMLLLPITPGTLAVGFVLFRIFDVAKLFPANRAERLRGGTGIVLDDLISGAYAHVVLRLALRLWPGLF